MGSRLVRVIALVLVTTNATACGASYRPASTFDSARPEAADAQSAHVVAATGSSAHRLALWAARNSAGDICPGWRLGGSGAPSSFHCQRRGLERPVLWVQGGGGTAENVDWGGEAGLVAPGVTRVEADGKVLHLRAAPHLSGWRVFADGGVTRPASSLVAYAGTRQLVDDSGLWINPDGQGCDCSRNGSGWSGTYAYVPEQQSGTDAQSVDVVLAEQGVSKILEDHGPAWIDLPVPWGNCTGRTIGQAADFKLWKEATFFATLPFMKPGVSGTHSAYMTGVHKVLARHSNELQVWVDTQSWRVVGVNTAFMHGIEIPIRTVEKPVPGGGDDDPSLCPKGD